MNIYKLKNGRYIVAEYDPKTNQYYAPMNAEEEKLTGCTTYVARNLISLGVHSFADRHGARRWAKANGYEINSRTIKQ